MSTENETDTLAEMFAEMRINMEGDLLELAGRYPETIPTCPSQKLRALRALEQVEAEIKRLSPARNHFEAIRPLFRFRERLNDFLAVHRAIELVAHKRGLYPSET